ncbi:unnamed protein product [Timema podura]|uniref:Uncharacterized protein n=1 Tax=Timema podura TaxID=61482 RepID=A0ABN7NHQ0_TIMPD|nr:unnamed protein product [Timema podura]
MAALVWCLVVPQTYVTLLEGREWGTRGQPPWTSVTPETLQPTSTNFSEMMLG